MAAEVLFIDNSMILKVTGVQDEDGNDITGATATADIYESDRSTQVGSQITLTDEGSGVYQGAIPDDVGVVLGTLYHLKVIIDKSPRKGLWWEPLRAKRRTFSDTG